jgi:glycosyltransferase involved in cell wall biosynthesis
VDLGGIQSVVFDLFRHFDAPRVKLSLAALHGPGRLHERFAAIGRTPTYAARVKCSPLLPVRLWHIMRRGGYHLVHAHGVTSCVLSERLSKAAGVPRCISHIHHIRQGRHSRWRPYTPIAYKKADLVLACSHAALDSFGALPGPHTHVVYNGVDVERFCPVAPEEVSAIRASLGLCPEHFVLGTSGRVVNAKGLVTLLEATQRTRRKIPSIRLLIVGSGPDEPRLKSRAAELGLDSAVHWVGHQHDVHRFLAAMDLFAFPSEVEGLGLSLIEAMACGLPCMVSDYAASHEIVKDSVDALRFQTGDASGLAAQIVRCFDNPALRARLGAAARERVVAAFSAKAMADRLAEVYLEVLSRSAGDGVNDP